MKKIDATQLARDSYKDYSLYVMETRALPSVYDGLKTVQRRILFVADQYPKKLTKTANMEGSVMKYHPHGGASFTTMAYPDNNIPIFVTKGNWGSRKMGISAAASRYTELYMSDIARFMYTQFIDDAEFIEGEIGHLEPRALPALLPYGLLEGSQGIGVGLSSKIVPLNVMDLIDYYIDYIQNGYSDRLVRPEFGASILLMTENEVKSNVNKYKGSFRVKPIIRKESKNIFVIDELHEMSIDTLLKKVSKYLDNESVDFIDESTAVPRYVFKVYDDKVLDQFEKDLNRFTTKKVTYTRVMIDNKTAVYSSLEYVVEKSLEYLNSVLDTRLDRLLKSYTTQLEIYLAISDLKNSKYLSKLPTYDNNKLINELLNTYNYNKDIWNKVLQKPISYLTKSHDSELEDLRLKINELKSHNRSEYLINLYQQLKLMLTESYNSKIHTVLEGELLSNPRIKLEGNKLVVNGNRRTSKNIEFDGEVLIVTADGSICPRTLSKSLRAEFSLDNLLSEQVSVGITSPLYEAVELLTNDSKSVIVETSQVKYDRRYCKLSDDQKIVAVKSYKELPDELRWKVRKRISKPM